MIITVTDLTKRFGKVRAADGVTFAVAPGEAVALWGTNGAGKTTIIRCILGVLRFRGRIAVGGHDVRRRGRRARALLGYVPQELGFHEDVRAADALRFFARLRAVEPRRAGTLLERVGLTGHGAKRVRELSGGMKQRLALALALLSDPPVVLLDEPTSNLDAAAREDAARTLADLKAAGKTILFASHRPEEVAALADRVLLLEKGRLVGERRPEDFRAPGADRGRLRLVVDDAHVAVAVRTLRTRGLDAHANGHGLCVAVSPGAKAEPIRILTQEGLRVNDFDLLETETEDTEAGR